ncbi:MAG: c-type cytochrome domain-containing protein [Planctomycetota bacterium]|nr:c-type cytochrome domain-containing protein [Planctomycetota bacterium]
MSIRYLHINLALLIICLGAVTALANDEATPDGAGISYYKDIRPIFQSHCQGCHQPAKKGGAYIMTDFSLLLQGGESEQAAIVPGNPDESYLVSLITAVDGAAEMPKGKQPLSSVEVDLVRKWIKQGAKNDAPASTQLKYSMDNPPVYSAAPVITSVHFSPDGKYLAISGFHEVLIHHADGSGLAARLVGMSERIETARFSPDSSKIAVTGGSPGRMGELQVWDISNKGLLLAQTIGYDTLYGANWSPDGKLISYGCPDNTSHALQVEDGKEILFNGAHNGWVLDTVFSVNGDHLVTVSRDRSMKLINVPTQRFIDNVTSITPGALKGGLNSVDRHPSKDELLCGGADGVPKVYKMFREKARKIGDDFNLIRAYPALQGRIFSTQFSKDGTKIVSGSSFNGTGQVKIANYQDAKEISSVDLDGGIFSVAFHPDGNTVAAAGFSGEVHLIEVATGNIIKSFVPVSIKTNVVGAEE